MLVVALGPSEITGKIRSGGARTCVTYRQSLGV